MASERVAAGRGWPYECELCPNMLESPVARVGKDTGTIHTGRLQDMSSHDLAPPDVLWHWAGGGRNKRYSPTLSCRGKKVTLKPNF